MEEESQPAEPTIRQWQLFEQEVARALADLDPAASVQHDAKVVGGLSNTTRQVDALCIGNVVGQQIRIVAECKRYTARVGIGHVDEFVGKLLDIGAEAGLMYSFAGYTPQAKARASGARNPSVELRQLPDEVGDSYQHLFSSLKFGDCPNPNCILGEVSWTAYGATNESFEAGECDSCGTMAVRCGLCGEMTVLDFGRQRCQSCEAVYEVVVDRKGMFESVRRVTTT